MGATLALDPRERDLADVQRDVEQWLHYYDFDRAHTGRLTRGRIPAEIVYGARKVKAR
jgi:hypothetical protein